MAISKVISTSSLIMEVEAGTDKTGATVYKKRSYGDIKAGAAVEDVFSVGTAITKVLAKETKDLYLAETSRLENSAE